jgi:MFS family permease
MRKLLADITPLRVSAAYRRLYVGNMFSGIGGSLTTFAVALQLYQLTHSAFAVGAVGIARIVPTLTVGLFGGSLADSVDRRRLVLITTSSLTVVSALLAAQAVLDLRRVWLIYLLVALQAVLTAVDGPARRTFTARLLPAELVPSGLALNQLNFQVMLIAGPAVAGVVTAATSLNVCYLLDVASFGAALYGLSRLPAMTPEGSIARAGVRAVGEGLRFIRRTPVVAGAFLADLNATVFGMPIALFPAINAERFGGSATTLGLLTAAFGAGGLVGSVFSGPVRHIQRPGRALLVTTTIWGAGIAAFGFAPQFWVGFGCLAIAGAADTSSVVFRGTIVQMATPDRLRGRVGAADYIVGFGGPQVGNIEAGAVGSLVSPTVSAISGGLGTVAGAALIGLLLPTMVRYVRPSTGSTIDADSSGAAEAAIAADFAAGAVITADAAVAAVQPAEADVVTAGDPIASSPRPRRPDAPRPSPDLRDGPERSDDDAAGPSIGRDLARPDAVETARPRS